MINSRALKFIGVEYVTKGTDPVRRIRLRQWTLCLVRCLVVTLGRRLLFHSFRPLHYLNEVRDRADVSVPTATRKRK